MMLHSSLDQHQQGDGPAGALHPGEKIIYVLRSLHPVHCLGGEIMLARSRAYLNVERIVDTLSGEDLEDENHILDFENRFRDYIGAERCYATNQARAALLIALRALNISPGDEVLVPDFTYEGVVDVILESGATPVFVEPALDDFNVPSGHFEEKITNRTKAIIATHLFGIPCDIADLPAIAKDNGCSVIEDCAQCLGAEFEGKNTGILGDFAIFSFNYEKHLTTGEGGMLAVNNPAFFEDVERVIKSCMRMPLYNEKCYVYGMLIQHMATERAVYKTDLLAYFGQNCCRADQEIFGLIDNLVQRCAAWEDIQDALLPYIEREIDKTGYVPPHMRNVVVKKALLRAGEVKSRVFRPPIKRIGSGNLLMGVPRALAGFWGLKDLQAVNAIRNRNAHLIYDAMQDNPSFLLPKVSPGKVPAFLKCNMINQTNHPLSAIIRNARIRGYEMGNIQWPRPVHLLPRFRHVASRLRDAFPVTSYLTGRIINIPVHCGVTPDDIEGMTACLAGFSDNTRPGREI